MTATGPGNLLTHLLAFGYLLREMGVPVSPGQMVDVAAAVGPLPVTNRGDFKAALRCMLVLRREDVALFDAAFEFYWRTTPEHGLDTSLMEAILPMTRIPRRHLRLRRRPRDEEPQEPKEEEEREEFDLQLTFSGTEVLRKKDFAQCSWEEVQACKALIQQMRWRIEERPTRRRQPDARGRALDFRRTLRRNMRYGGEVLQLSWRETRTTPRPLVVICDISGSMERYSRILLQFVHAITEGLGEVESFVFGTRLTRITRQLRHNDIDDSLDAVSKHVVDWSGGTRIGDAIKEFNYRWGRRVLHHGPVVLLISDGWDRGDATVLRREMDRLQRSCHRLIWLNPLLGTPGYEPLTVGMQAALPYVDDFLPVHNLVSLEQLGKQLSALSARPPARRQRPLSTL
jgi:uncharacterized protein with von Willebrand factor type A (vWA) domain